MDSQITTATPSALALGGGPDYGALMEAAIAQGQDGVEALERIVALQERIMERDAKAAFLRAMTKAKGEFPRIVKNVPGQHGVTTKGTRRTGLYAPLDTITAAIDPVCADNGLSYTFDRATIEGEPFVLCIVRHVDGHEQSAKFPAFVDEGRGRSKIQGIASGETYAKRYALIAAFGLTMCDPDDDAQRAGSQPPSDEPPITAEQAANIEALLDELGDTNNAERIKALKWAGAPNVESIPAGAYTQVVKALEAKRK